MTDTERMPTEAEMMAELDEIAAKNGINWGIAERVTATADNRTRYATPGAASGRGVVRKVSDAQVRLIRRLLAERDTSNLARLPGSADVTNMSLRGASDLIDRLQGCPLRTVAAPADPQADPDYDVQHQVALMTDKQRVSLEREIPRRQVTNPIVDGVVVRLADGRKISRITASKALDLLFAAPFKPREITVTQVTDIEVPSGRYAIEVDGVVKFYKVNHPTEGRWAGRTFVDTQASDDYYPVKNPAVRNSILKAIAADIQTALQRYGQELGTCGYCGHTLTDEQSRDRGIGPVCWGRLGY